MFTVIFIYSEAKKLKPTDTMLLYVGLISSLGEFDKFYLELKVPAKFTASFSGKGTWIIISIVMW